jgi:esterase/lipase superfamily enzyme
VAVLVRGGVSATEGRWSIRKTPRHIKRVNEQACFASIKRNIVLANPEADRDFFVHSWQVDMAKKLALTFTLVSSKYEENRIFRSQIYLGVLRNLANAVVRKPLLVAQRLGHPIK